MFGIIVDDVVVYSSDTETEEAIFRDDFESYPVGHSLDPNAATADTAPIEGAVSEPNTRFDSNSFEVVVGEQ